MKENKIVWLAPALIANSLIGFIYMILENDSLNKIGTGAFGRKFKTNTLLNICIHTVVMLLS